MQNCTRVRFMAPRLVTLPITSAPAGVQAESVVLMNLNLALVSRDDIEALIALAYPQYAARLGQEQE